MMRNLVDLAKKLNEQLGAGGWFFIAYIAFMLVGHFVFGSQGSVMDADDPVDVWARPLGP